MFYVGAPTIMKVGRYNRITEWILKKEIFTSNEEL